MNINILFKQGVLVVRLDGELDVHGAGTFKEMVEQAIDKYAAKHLLINFKGATFIDSSGLGVILGRYKRLSLVGGTMIMSNIQPQVFRILELSGLLKIIRVYATETEALQNF